MGTFLQKRTSALISTLKISMKVTLKICSGDIPYFVPLYITFWVRTLRHHPSDGGHLGNISDDEIRSHPRQPLCKHMFRLCLGPKIGIFSPQTESGSK